ncbi:hypothetical protein D8B26_008393 [Coccidioides posadasii str. Silveira]|uniref:uncharacterized protein n=1 Tax=Coccidioides posadasii (strain RMSCC 757 / Silveira) TaxID=443226 RepID=UPI001BEF702C|nr:hypothetical protein D8B26_008393 [Coccidioides posadasii str. Silveira]
MPGRFWWFRTATKSSHKPLEGLFDKRATKESTTGCPVYRFLPKYAKKRATGTTIMPPSFWRLDLSPDSWKENTVTIPNTRRFPQKLIYLKAIIDTVADRYEVRGLNEPFRAKIIYSLTYSTMYLFTLRERRFAMRDGGYVPVISPEAARALIPRKDLKPEAIRAKYKAVANIPTSDASSSTESRSNAP